jgi:hypothetical protein
MMPAAAYGLVSVEFALARNPRWRCRLPDDTNRVEKFLQSATCSSCPPRPFLLALVWSAADRPSVRLGSRAYRVTREGQRVRRPSGKKRCHHPVDAGGSPRCRCRRRVGLRQSAAGIAMAANRFLCISGGVADRVSKNPVQTRQSPVLIIKDVIRRHWANASAHCLVSQFITIVLKAGLRNELRPLC